MNQDKLEESQRAVCSKYNAEFCSASPLEKLGIAVNVRAGVLPINGLRHPPAGGTSGWYVWGGEQMGTDRDYFLPLHIEHLDEWCPQVQKYLGLAPGWRFLIAEDYEDVWFDPALLGVT